MRDLSNHLYSYETGKMDSQPSRPGQLLVDVADRNAVLKFTYHYLQARSRPANDCEVHNVTSTIARYKGPRVVEWGTLESFLAGLVTDDRA